MPKTIITDEMLFIAKNREMTVKQFMQQHGITEPSTVYHRLKQLGITLHKPTKRAPRGGADHYSEYVSLGRLSMPYVLATGFKDACEKEPTSRAGIVKEALEEWLEKRGYIGDGTDSEC